MEHTIFSQHNRNDRRRRRCCCSSSLQINSPLSRTETNANAKWRGLLLTKQYTQHTAYLCKTDWEISWVQCAWCASFTPVNPVFCPFGVHGSVHIALTIAVETSKRTQQQAEQQNIIHNILYVCSSTSKEKKQTTYDRRRHTHTPTKEKLKKHLQNKVNKQKNIIDRATETRVVSTREPNLYLLAYQWECYQFVVDDQSGNSRTISFLASKDQNNSSIVLIFGDSRQL